MENNLESVLAVCQKFVSIANCIEKSRDSEQWWAVKGMAFKESKRVVIRRASHVVLAYELVDDGMIRNVLYSDLPPMSFRDFCAMQFSLLNMVENYLI